MKHLPIIVLLLLTACGQGGETGNEEALAGSTPDTPAPAGDVDAPADVRFQVVAAENGAAPDSSELAVTVVPDHAGGKAQFTFEVGGFELKTQTPDAPERGCANSPDGQHIHFILNNKPYLAKYEPSFTEAIDPGHNVLLAFLSRSYHESLKEPAAYVLTEFTTTGGGGVPQVDLKEDPMLFYSRPKGDYKMSDGPKVLLDFYLHRISLSRNGYRVRATIDGAPFLLYAWKPYFIEGLGLGEHTVRIELLDKDGQLVPGPFNDSGERTFRLLEG